MRAGGRGRGCGRRSRGCPRCPSLAAPPGTPRDAVTGGSGCQPARDAARGHRRCCRGVRGGSSGSGERWAAGTGEHGWGSGTGTVPQESPGCPGVSAPVGTGGSGAGCRSLHPNHRTHGPVPVSPLLLRSASACPAAPGELGHTQMPSCMELSFLHLLGSAIRTGNTAGTVRERERCPGETAMS